MRRATSNVEAVSQRRRKEGGRDYGLLSHAALVFSAMVTSTMYAELDPRSGNDVYPIATTTILIPKHHHDVHVQIGTARIRMLIWEF